jgi:hypothetical protein
MARHLVAEGELVGRTRADLVGLLGPPSGVERSGELEWHLGERAGPTPIGLLLNYDEFLLVILDERGLCRVACIEGWD